MKIKYILAIWLTGLFANVLFAQTPLSPTELAQLDKRDSLSYYNNQITYYENLIRNAPRGSNTLLLQNYLNQYTAKRDYLMANYPIEHLFKFNLTGIGSNDIIESAQLLVSHNQSMFPIHEDQLLKIQAVDESWTASGVDYDHKPTLRYEHMHQSLVRNADTYSFDITQMVRQMVAQPGSDYGINLNMMSNVLGQTYSDITHAGVLTISLQIQVSPSNRAVNDAQLNYTVQELYDENSNIYSKNIQYFDYMGMPLQKQRMDYVNNQVMASELIYDQFGRLIITTPEAPIGMSVMNGYKEGFVTDINNLPLDYEAGSLPLSTDVGTLGHYYSHGNMQDAYTPATGFPYSKIEYNLDLENRVKSVTKAGEAYYLGNRKQRQVYSSSSNELLHLLGLDLDEYAKNVTMDEDGSFKMEYFNAQGQPIAVAENVTLDGSHMSYTSLKRGSSVYIRINQEQLNSLSIYNGSPNITNTNGDIYSSQEFSATIKDITNNVILYDGWNQSHPVEELGSTSLCTIHHDANDDHKWNFTFADTYDPASLQRTLFLQITINDMMPSYYNQDFYVEYEDNDYQWTLYEYDDKGNMTRMIPPIAIEQYIKPYLSGGTEFIYGSNATNIAAYGSTAYHYFSSIASLFISGDHVGEYKYKMKADLNLSDLDNGLNGNDDGIPAIWPQSWFDYEDAHPNWNPIIPDGNFCGFSSGNGDGVPVELGGTADDNSYTSRSIYIPDGSEGSSVESVCAGMFKTTVRYKIDTRDIRDPEQALPSEYITKEYITYLFRRSDCNYYLISEDINDRNFEIEREFDDYIIPYKLSASISSLQYQRAEEPTVWTDLMTPTEFNTFGAESADVDYYREEKEFERQFGQYFNITLGTIEVNRIIKQQDALINNSMVSTYTYNSDNQMVSSTSPDEGTIEMRYNQWGQLRFMQNAQQAIDQVYSYTQYDVLGRVIETGIVDENQTGYDFGSPAMIGILDELGSQNSIPSYAKSQIHYTLYDAEEQDPTGINGFNQTGLQNLYHARHLEGRVSKTWNNNSITWYSYNSEGQLEWTVQYIKALGEAKTVDYEYDMLGNVSKTIYQKHAVDYADRFDHEYNYDNNKALSEVITKRYDGTYNPTPPPGKPITPFIGMTYAQAQTKYLYTQQGQVKRVELGGHVQGIDYTYTANGWLKAINHPELFKVEPSLSQLFDPGQDSKSDGTHSGFYADVFGMSLDYYSDDYQKRLDLDGNSEYELGSYFNSLTDGLNYYSGDIRSQRWSLRPLAGDLDAGKDQWQYLYGYNRKKQLKWAEFNQVETTTENWSSAMQNSTPLPTPLDYTTANNPAVETLDLGIKKLNLDVQAYNVPSLNQKVADTKGRIDRLKGMGIISTFGEYNEGQDLLDSIRTDILDIDQLIADSIGVEVYRANIPGGDSFDGYFTDGLFQTLTTATIFVPNTGGSGTGGQTQSDDYVFTENATWYNAKMADLATKKYSVFDIDYDKQGNIMQLKRNNETATLIDDITYNYEKHTVNGVELQKNNKLNYAGDAVTLVDNSHFKPGQTTDNYVYNANGQLVSEQLSNLNYTYMPNGKVKSISLGGVLKVEYLYDDKGQKLKKTDHDLNTETWYIRDVSGRLVSRYSRSSILPMPVELKEVPLYGNSRVGIFDVDLNRYIYEIKDHLGNVRATVSENSACTGIDVLSYSDYFPGGSPMPGRKYVGGSGEYRYGFQGQEKEDLTGQISFELREYDAQLMRFQNPDPYGQYISPYLAMGNNPVNMIDPDGGFAWKPDGDGNWIAEAGDGAWQLHEDANISFDRAKEIVSNMNMDRGQESQYMVFQGDVVNIGSNIADLNLPSVSRTPNDLLIKNFVETSEGSEPLFSFVEERFIQVTGILGISGPTVGLSIAKLPDGSAEVYWNHGNTSGVDLPSIDIGGTIHISQQSDINWKHKLQGNSTDYGGSISFVGATFGGNQKKSDFFSPFMEDYGSVSFMLNLGPNDLGGGVNKNTVNQERLFTIPSWLGAPW